jgi:hypothetical protein
MPKKRGLLIATQTHKQCCMCNRILPHEQFHKQRTGRFGLRCICKDCVNSYGAARYRKNPKIINSRHGQWRRMNRARINAGLRAVKRQVKLEAFDAYGGRFCACCGETILEFLTLDHINNDGAQHRRENRIKGPIYGWLARHGWPPGFQVLCMQCNFGKRMNHGVCPHKERNQQGIPFLVEERSA